MTKKDNMERLILGIIDEDEIPCHEILKRFERRGIPMIYDTLAKYLKMMTEEHKVKREAKGRPWQFYYRLA